MKLFLFCLLVCTLYYLYQVSDNSVLFVYTHDGHSTRCILPEIDPFDPKMMKFVWNPGSIVCDNPSVVYVDLNNSIQFNETALKLLNEKQTNVKCSVYLVERVDDDNIKISKPLPWKPSSIVPGDFFRIKCHGSKGILVDNYLTRIEKRKKDFSSLKEELKKDKYNVLLFGIDSLSRSAAIRQLPKTYKYLTETLEGYDFKGYTKVADNTFVNIVPLLSGRFLYKDELPKIDYINEWLDGLPLIWKNFSAEKTATLFVEDYPNLNVFNMEKKGFLNPPTDHYMRPFWRAIKLTTLFHTFRSDWARRIQQTGIKLPTTSGLCNGDKPNHVVVMDYIRQFMATYKENRKFMLSFLTELGHEYQNLMQLGDDDIQAFFQWLSDNSFLNDTILIIFSDHGMRFGNVQHLYVARIESRMPFLSIVLPQSLKRKYPHAAKSMRINQERLSTTFDLHATLRDILDGNFNNPNHFTINGKLRGISLFKELPGDRSCADASISKDICPCHKSTKLNITDNPLADKIAVAVIRHINSVLHKHNQCAKLRLRKIIELSKSEQGLKHVGTFQRKSWWFRWKTPEAEVREDTRHSIVFETIPGSGRFYATCDVFANSTIKVYGNVDRVNKYGNQSSCVHEHKLKHLCYCLETSKQLIT